MNEATTIKAPDNEKMKADILQALDQLDNYTLRVVLAFTNRLAEHSKA